MRTDHILIIEDEHHIAEGLKLHLELQGHQVSRARDGQEGVHLWAELNPDLIILDIMMPKLDGHKVLELIRKKDQRLPILILSARDSAQDKVKALASGVDDYLAKPFDAEELILRVERLLLRSAWYREQKIVPEEGASLELPKKALRPSEQIGAHQIDLKTGEVNGGEFTLTDQELKLLKVFLTYEGIPMARKDLLQLAWDYSDSMETRTLDNFIVRLRKYFEEDSRQPRHFISVRSVGYEFRRS